MLREFLAVQIGVEMSQQHGVDSLVKTEQFDGYSVVTMNSGENRFSPDFLDALLAGLSSVEAAGGGLVLSGAGKYFCNGLDLEFLMSATQEESLGVIKKIYDAVERVMYFPGPTVAAINGHVFGAGVVLAAGCDFRVMNSQRGYFCFPEADLGLAFSAEMQAVLNAKYHSSVLLPALLSARRYGGNEAAQAGLVNQAVEPDKVIEASVEVLGPMLGKGVEIMRLLKESLFGTADSIFRASI